jgi:hypothetical protein
MSAKELIEELSKGNQWLDVVGPDGRKIEEVHWFDYNGMNCVILI